MAEARLRTSIKVVGIAIVVAKLDCNRLQLGPSLGNMLREGSCYAPREKLVRQYGHPLVLLIHPGAHGEVVTFG